MNAVKPSNILLLGGCGYVGSSLYEHLTERKYSVTTVDLEWYGNVSNPQNKKLDIASLEEEFISGFDTIVLLAGHSSVKMCAGELRSAFQNNVSNFVSLLSKLSPTQKFLYASSSSVYGTTAPNNCTEDHTEYRPENAYDYTKHTIDAYAILSNKQYYGLRFGTVNGPAPHLRTDLMLNAMYKAGKETGIISLFNKAVHRPILGTHDLNCAVETIITTAEDKRGIYNLASVNSTAGELAETVKTVTGFQIEEKVPVEPHNSINAKLETNTYDFSISSEKFSRAFNFTFKETAESIVEGLVARYDSMAKTSRHEPRPYK